MKLAISNIGWAPGEAPAVYGMMQDYGFAGLEIAPALAFPQEADPLKPSPSAVDAFRAELANFGLHLVSMQSLLYGVSSARLFGSGEELVNFERAMLRAIELAGAIGIPNIVFGSPKNRAYPDGMPPEQVQAHAFDVFRRLGECALKAGTVIALEPNPAVYGTNFLTTVEAAAKFVVALDHPGVTLNYDLGALYTSGERSRAGAIYELANGRVSHVHISEPDLAPAPADPAKLREVAAELLAQGYSGWFSIEMRRPSTQVFEQLGKCLSNTAQAMAPLRRTY